MTPPDDAAGESAERTLLLLIRHAEQETMLELDPPLSSRGRLQAERLGERLAGLPLTAVVSSPLRRARSTAEPTARALGLEVVVHPDLDEIRFEADAMRDTFSKTSAKAMEPDPDDYVRTAMAAVHVVPRFVWGGPGSAESGEKLRARAATALAEVVADNPGGVVACFTHGGFLCASLGSWLGIDRDMWFVPWHTGISAVMVTPNDKVVLTVNDVSHLAPDEDVLNVATHNLDRAGDGLRR
jgi:broad specificity phosphatase PhoE